MTIMQTSLLAPGFDRYFGFSPRVKRHRLKPWLVCVNVKEENDASDSGNTSNEPLKSHITFHIGEGSELSEPRILQFSDYIVISNDSDNQAGSSEKSGAPIEIGKSSSFLIGTVEGTEEQLKLIEALKDKDPKVQESAAYKLGEMGVKRAEGALIEALKDKNPKVQQSAAFALHSIKAKEEEMVWGLIRALKDKDPKVRGSVAYTLGEMRAERAKRALIKVFLKDEEASVRGNALRALDMMGAKAALVEALNDFVNNH